MKNATNWIRAAVLLPLLGVWGCQGSGGAPLPTGMPQAPCLCAQGQISESCKIPYQNAQVCPDLSPVAFCSRYVGASVSLPILLFNRGLSGLQISKVELVGDDNCAFNLKTSFDPGKIISYMGSEALQIAYRPTQAKADSAMLRITSTAENFPVLSVPVCGQGVPVGTPVNLDGGVCPQQCPAARSEKPACGTVPDGGV